MKKLLSVFIACMLIVFALSGCTGADSYENLTGTVTDVEINSEYKYPVYTITTPENYQVKVTLEETSHFFSWIDDVDGNILASGDLSAFDEVKIGADYDKAKVRKSSGEVIVARAMYIDEILYKNVKTLSDGTAVDMWDSGYYVIYQLADGTELLRDSRPKKLKALDVASIATSYGEISETAQNKILDFYNEKGLLFSADPYIEKAYQNYMSDKDAFGTANLDLNVVATGSNDRVVHFLVMMHTPLTANTATESRYGVTFDRSTGEFIDPMSMFSCDEQQVKETIVNEMWNEIEDTADQAIKAQLIKQFKGEYLIFFEYGVELCYPAGALDGVDNTYILASEAVIEDCTEEIYAIMHPWAIPENPE